MNSDLEKLNILESDEELTVQFFEGTTCFENDSVKINNVRFYPKEDSEDKRDFIMGAIVNSSKEKTWFEFYLDEIKEIFDSQMDVLWRNDLT